VIAGCEAGLTACSVPGIAVLAGLAGILQAPAVRVSGIEGCHIIRKILLPGPNLPVLMPSTTHLPIIAP